MTLLLLLAIDGPDFPPFPAEPDIAPDYMRQPAAVRGHTLVPVPPTTFQMGTRPGEVGRRPGEVLHTVVLTEPAWLGREEVPRSLWVEVMGSRPWRGCSDIPDGTEAPADCVSWLEAAVFCNRLSEAEGLQPAYQIDGDAVRWDPAAGGYRLPTEAEWERAARGGQPWRWSSGDAAPACAPGPQAPPEHQNALGLVNLSGGAAEWVWDWRGPLAEADAWDPTGPASGTERVVKGGQCGAPPMDQRAAARDSAPPGQRAARRGLRLARTIR